MARNPIQFQPGLLLPAFLEQYGTEAKCQDALFQHRWPRAVSYTHLTLPTNREV